jgi:hypothetical protein
VCVAGALSVLGGAGCDDARKAECDKFITAMKPLDQGIPSADQVDRVQHEVDGLKFSDQPLGVYAKNYSATLTVLSSTLKLKDAPEAPDGTQDVIKSKLKEARTDKEDTLRYCSK